jgi:hypothetical protein
VTGGDYREFPMASGEMTDAQFLAFNLTWIGAALPHLCDGGVLVPHAGNFTPIPPVKRQAAFRSWST